MNRQLVCAAVVTVFGLLLIGCGTSGASSSKTASVKIESSTTTMLKKTIPVASATTTTETTTTTTTIETTTTVTTTEVTTTNTPGALSDKQLRYVATQLGVPEDMQLTYTQSSPTYWDSAELWITYVNVYQNGVSIASAGVNSYTGLPERSIQMYYPPYDSSESNWGDGDNNRDPEEINGDSSEYWSPYDDTPNVYCPSCGYGWFTTGVGDEGFVCPSCGYNWYPYSN